VFASLFLLQETIYVIQELTNINYEIFQNNIAFYCMIGLRISGAILILILLILGAKQNNLCINLVLGNLILASLYASTIDIEPGVNLLPSLYITTFFAKRCIFMIIV
jgi:hypothetical protein